MQGKEPTVISLFSGAGGMDLGFKNAGFNIILANDIDRDSCITYAQNFGTTPINSDIHTIKNFPKADVVIAGIPCQGFSITGKRVETDKRNFLYKEVLRCIDQAKPSVVVIENVSGLVSLYKGKFLKNILRGFEERRYQIKWQILNAVNYGVPQRRKRIFIIAVKKGLKEYNFPAPTHGAGKKPFVTLQSALKNLPKPNNQDYIKENWSFFYMSRNRRAYYNEPSYTIQAMAKHAPLHPASPPMRKVKKDKFIFTASAKKYRRLSFRECARIQTFPDNFIFNGSLESKYRQIGNAVPPKLSTEVAKTIKILYE